MDRLDSMKIFVRVAELASFTKAAESMNLPKATISTAIQKLETQLDSQLFHRTTRKVQLTQDGQAFYERSLDLISDFEEAQNMFKNDPKSISGRIRVDMSTGLSRNIIVPKLPDFSKMYPEIELELSSTDRRVDIIREGFDCVFRVGRLSDSSLIVKNLGDFKVINCVSAHYIKEFGKPKKIEDLNKHQLIHYAPVLGSKADGFEYFDGEKYRTISMKGKITVNNSDSYTSACLSGFGIIQTPVVGIKNYLRSGELVEILPKYLAEPMPISLIYPNRRNLSKRVRVFMDWASEVVKKAIV